MISNVGHNRRLSTSTSQPSMQMAIGEKFTVLLVEDEPIIRMGIADYINSQGYDVVEAGSGDGAMDIIRAGKPIDVIVTDVQMPGKHDGIALALWARRNFPHIKLIIVSGATSGTVEPNLLGDEGSIMPKPYQYNLVAARIAELLGSLPLARATRLDLPFDASRQ